MNGPIGSIFDIYRIGKGPSSSHSIGPQRAARIFRERLPQPPDRIEVELRGSLAETGKGHLTDQTISNELAGLPHHVIWNTQAPTPRHPNTLLLRAYAASGDLLLDWEVYSVGGGALEDAHGPVGSISSIRYPFSGITEILAHCEKNNLTLWHLVAEIETDPWPRLDTIWNAMRASVEAGLESTDILLPGSLKLARRAHTTWLRGQNLQSPQRDIAQLSAFALAVAEENAAAGTIVTAPTCGPAGVLPGLLYYFEEIKRTPRKEILRALATAGLFGSVIRANASISGAEVGCQGEIGSACSMAAAAGSQLQGGSLHQIEYAAEIGMEHHLGLTCDPIEGYVQIPCIERNMTACLRAFECASFSLLTDGKHLVSFDDVIDVMYRTGLDIQSAYRETARGGLADLWRRRAASPTFPIP
ncbi:MAG TPA: L-serine ammonia-lyase, iron-sulfur-dependent, subunit alpha [Kiritimatiellia bacterium]|nr:L-serine ammonia-lyase, iron-sulfur-dependent, subunit alpha [Kiritimatiellia bacterium]